MFLLFCVAVGNDVTGLVVAVTMWVVHAWLAAGTRRLVHCGIFEVIRADVMMCWLFETMPEPLRISSCLVRFLQTEDAVAWTMTPTVTHASFLCVQSRWSCGPRPPPEKHAEQHQPALLTHATHSFK